MAQDSDGINLASLLSSVKTATVNAADTIQKLTTIGGQEQNTYDDMLTAVMGGTDSQGDTVLTKQAKVLGELQTQDKKAEFYRAIGMGGEGAAKISNELAARYTESLHQALQLSDSVKQRKSVGFTDNPLAYMWNQIVLPDEEAALSGAVSDAKLASDGMQAVNQMAQQTAKTEKDYEQTTNLAAAQSAVEATANNIRGQADQVRLKAQQANAQNLQTIMSANAQQVSMIHTGVAAQQSARQLQLSEAANSRAAEQFQVWKKETADTDAYYDKMADFVALGAAQTGRPALDPADIKRALKGKASAGMLQDVQLLADIGWKNSQNAAENFQLAGTPAASIATANSLKVPVPEGISALQAAASNAVHEKAKMNPELLKDKVAMATEFNSAMVAVVKAQQAHVDYKDGTNQYVIPSTKVMAKAAAVQGTQFYQKVLEPEISVGKLDTSDPAVIIQKGLAAVKAGQISLGQLGQDIVTYYQTGVQANNAQKQFTKFGVAPQTTYNADFKILSELAQKPGNVGEVLLAMNPFSGKSTVTKDLTNLTEVNSLLVKMYKVEGGTIFGGTK